MQEVPPTEPVDEGDEGEWDTVGNPLGVVAQLLLLKSSWRSWSVSPLLLRGARSPQLPPLKRWWPQESRRTLHRLASLQGRQWPPRRKKKRPPRVDW
jgi:hypothetical protein